MTACQYNIGKYQVKYNAEFPESPEVWMEKGGAVFPEMIEKCYSVDCEVFSNGEIAILLTVRFSVMARIQGLFFLVVTVLYAEIVLPTIRCMEIKRRELI